MSALREIGIAGEICSLDFDDRLPMMFETGCQYHPRPSSNTKRSTWNRNLNAVDHAPALEKSRDQKELARH